MRSRSTRSALISIAAIGAAVIWGVVELLALQWSRFNERGWPQGTFRPF